MRRIEIVKTLRRLPKTGTLPTPKERGRRKEKRDELPAWVRLRLGRSQAGNGRKRSTSAAKMKRRARRAVRDSRRANRGS
jgi:hypothetical protein